MKKITIVVVIIILITLCSLAHSGMQPKEGGSLVFAQSVDILSIDPASAYSFESSRVLAHVFEGLVRYSHDYKNIEPALAVSWTVANDKKQWTFKLRKNVRFHDGSAFNAYSVLFSFQRIIDKKHPFHPSRFGYGANLLKQLKSVKVLDEYTVKFVLDKPVAPFLSILSTTVCHIVNPVSFKKMKTERKLYAIGTGPFTLKEWLTGDRVLLEKSNQYWGEKPYLNKIEFKQIKNKHDRLTGLKAGTIHVTDIWDLTNIEKIKKIKKLKLKYIPGANVSILTINNEKKPFDDVNVRKALAYAINKKKLVKYLYQQTAIPAVSVIPSSIWGHNKDLVDYDYNPEKAKALLA